MAYSSSITSKGQVTIPVEIRRLLGLEPHDRVTFSVEDHRVVLVPWSSVVDRTAGALRSELPPLSPQEEKRVAEEEMAAQAEPGLRS